MCRPSIGPSAGSIVSAERPPSTTPAASSKPSRDGLRAITPDSRTQTYSAFAPPLIPKTSSPAANWVTAAPASSTTPANSIPAIVRFGRTSPVSAREKKYSVLRSPQSLRVTLVAWTRTSTSSACGAGRSTSLTLSTSGGP